MLRQDFPIDGRTIPMYVVAKRGEDMTILIREYSEHSDIERVVEILNQWNVIPTSVDAMRSSTPPVGGIRRVVLCDDDWILGFCATAPAGDDCYFTQPYVDLDQRRRGFGQALLDDALGFIADQGANRVESRVRDDDPISQSFASKRGFEVTDHNFRSMLVVSEFDAAVFSDWLARAQEIGIHFKLLSEMSCSDDLLKEIYELQEEIASDIPGNGPARPRRSFEEYCRRVRENPDWTKHKIVAFHGSRIIGLAFLKPHHKDGRCYVLNDLTGVARGYRGRGVAKALKVVAVSHARQCGADYLWTWNNSHNTPIIRLNQKMGYRPEPGTYTLAKRLSR